MEIKVIPRIWINGVKYTLDSLGKMPEEEFIEIHRKRIERGMNGANYEKKSA